MLNENGEFTWSWQDCTTHGKGKNQFSDRMCSKHRENFESKKKRIWRSRLQYFKSYDMLTKSDNKDSKSFRSFLDAFKYVCSCAISL